MEKIVITYRNKLMRRSALYGSAFVVIGIASMFFGTMSMHFFTAMGLFHVATAIYYSKYPYVTLDDRQVMIGWRKIQRDTITQIRQFAGDITISSGKKEFTINREMAEDSSRPDLERLYGILADRIESNTVTQKL